MVGGVVWRGSRTGHGVVVVGGGSDELMLVVVVSLW